MRSNVKMPDCRSRSLACVGPTGPTGAGGPGPTGPGGPTGPTGSGGGGAALGDIVYDASVPASGGNVFKTWAEVQTYIAAATVPFNLWMVDSGGGFGAEIPGTGVTDFKGLVTMRGLNKSGGETVVLVTVDDGATLRDLFEYVNCEIVTNGTVLPAFDYTGSFVRVFFINTTLFVAGPIAAYDVPTGKNVQYFLINPSGFVAQAFQGGPNVVTIQNGGFFSLVSQGLMSIGGDCVAGAVGSTFSLYTDAGQQGYPQFTGLLGTFHQGGQLAAPQMTLNLNPVSPNMNPGQTTGVDCSGGNKVVTLPPGLVLQPGTQVGVKCVALGGGNTVTVNTPDGALIDGAATDVMTPTTKLEAAVYQYTGDAGLEWIIVATAFR